jgi:hypothetical protein
MSTLKAMLFSVCCHCVATILYKDYIQWFHSLKTYFEEKNKDIREERAILYYAGLIFHMFNGIFICGMLEVFNFSQSKSLVDSGETNQ